MFAATPPLTKSILEFTTITSAVSNDPNFQNIIPVTDFIVDIERITKKINTLRRVKYKVVTRTPKTEKKHSCIVKYIATINVAPNPGIGPNIVTMVSLRKARKHHD